MIAAFNASLLPEEIASHRSALPWSKKSRFGVCLLVMLVMMATGCRSTPDPSLELQRAAALEQFYAEWRGTPHVYGGNSRRGVDCSALVAAAYSDLYGLRIPRTTEDQEDIGRRVFDLRSGDLVFFKTGWFSRHVGIYVGDGMFIHSSESSGVTRSSLDSPYWRKHYWKAKRILD